MPVFVAAGAAPNKLPAGFEAAPPPNRLPPPAFVFDPNAPPPKAGGAAAAAGADEPNPPNPPNAGAEGGLEAGVVDPPAAVAGAEPKEKPVDVGFAGAGYG